jgi:hypothetical protein
MLTNAILDRPWIIQRCSDNAEFITSDTPVQTALPDNSEFLPGNGLNTKGVLVVFPLNPSTYLTIGKLEHVRNTLPSLVVDKLNELQVICTTAFAYSRSYLPTIAQMVPARGGKLRFGENSFLLPQERMPVAKEYVLAFLQQKLERKFGKH